MPCYVVSHRRAPPTLVTCDCPSLPPSYLGGGRDLGVGGVRCAGADVVPNGPREQHRLEVKTGTRQAQEASNSELTKALAHFGWSRRQQQQAGRPPHPPTSCPTYPIWFRSHSRLRSLRSCPSSLMLPTIGS